MSHLFVCFVTLIILGVVCIYITIDIIYDITYNLYCATKWPFPRSRELDFGLEFERNGFEEHFIFTEGSSKPIRDNQVIRVAGDSLFFELNIEGNYKLCR